MVRSRWVSTSIAGFVLEAPSLVRGHMELSEPYAVYSKNGPQTAEASKDYSMTSPLDKGGADFPAKLRCTTEILSAVEPVATLVSGQDFSWNLGGTAVHNGGSCQVGISYDACATMAVMASWIGGCPLELPYTFKVPELPGADKAFFWWSWENHSGNRELYNNVAVVAVEGTADSYVGPTMYRVNSFSDGSCILPEGTDVVYPAPSDQVFYGGDYSESSPPDATTLDNCDYDQTATVTVKNDGGGSGPTGGTASGGATGSKTSTNEAATATGTGDVDASETGSADKPTETGGSAGDSSSGTSKTALTTTSGAASTARSGNSGEGTSGGDQNDGDADSSTGSSSSSGGSGSGSSSSSSGSSIPDLDSTFVEFAIGAVALIVVAGLAICLIHSRQSNSYAATEGYDSSDGSSRHHRGGRSRSRRYRDDSYSDDYSSSEDEEPRRHRRHRR